MDLSYGKQSTCIAELPDDPLCLIYQKLNKVRDQKSFSRTCHRFLDITILCCKCLDVSSSTKLSKSYNLDSIVLGTYLYRFRHFESPSSISVIDLYHCEITDNGLETLTKYCKTLMNVNLVCCSHITNTGILFLKQNCRLLRVLKISGCDRVVGVRSQQGFLATLACLQADSHVLNPSGFLSGGGIEYLSITYSKNKPFTSKLGLSAIGSGIAKNLKMLSLFMRSFVTDDCMHSVVTDDCIIKISSGCPLLQELNLSYCNRIGLRGWESIGLHCQNLERLHVNSCNNLCDRGLLALGNGCKLLSVLYMTNCPRITSSGKDKFKILRADVEIVEKIGKINFPSWTFTCPVIS
ncbi:F-box/LRR-repeat protein 12-like [Rutidosis leptorrhynchoides]|uniref:F-box/LRR-repeat protein 12-like n=1 Tax=Rutidosis leptorrhynchoides TaxID=125765 RepID=UPI003A99A7D0